LSQAKDPNQPKQ